MPTVIQGGSLFVLPRFDPALVLEAIERERITATMLVPSMLYVLVVIPATGLVLVLSGDDDLLWLHVAAHVAFFVALAVHVVLTLSRRLLPRML